MMKRLSLGCTAVLIGTAVLFPLPANADPNNDCWAADRGAGSEVKSEHYNWAQNKSADAIANNLSGKVAMLFNCSAVSGDQLAVAFGQISSLIAQRANDVRCFSGDVDATGISAAAHEQWARTKSREQVRDNLAWKSGAAVRCLDEGNNRLDFFAEESVMLARVPGGAAPASGGNCNSGQYSVAAVPAARTGQQITVNWTAPANHSTDDWIAIWPEDTRPQEGSGSVNRRVPAGPCGNLVLTAPAPGKHIIYYLLEGRFTSAGNTVPLTVNP